MCDSLCALHCVGCGTQMFEIYRSQIGVLYFNRIALERAAKESDSLVR